MSKVEIEDFSSKDISRIFIAGSIREAERAEALLTEHSISYAVQIEEFVTTGVLSGSVKKGVVFYVLSGQGDCCRRLLEANDLKRGLIDND